LTNYSQSVNGGRHGGLGTKIVDPDIKLQLILVPRALLTRRGALAKSISNWHLIGHNEGYCSNTGYILLPCFYGTRLWIWPEPLVAPRVRRALGTRMTPAKVRLFVLPTHRGV
jgi:hypothetical protein